MQPTKIFENMTSLSLITGILSGIFSMIYLFTYNEAIQDNLMGWMIFSLSIVFISTLFGFGLSIATHFLTKDTK